MENEPTNGFSSSKSSKVLIIVVVAVVVALAAFFLISDYLSNRGLVGYWHFDENASATAQDASGMENNLNFAGNPGWQSDSDCKAESCLSFNGIDSYLGVSSTPSLNIADSMTIEVWMKPDAWADGQSRGIVSKKANDSSNGYVLYNDGVYPTKLNFRISGVGYLYSKANVDVGEWQHWAVTYDAPAEEVKIYKNGALDNTYPSINVSDLTNSEDFQIGRSQTWNGYFSGDLDEVRIYDRALSAQQISDHYEDLK
jgi:hypothetical protein